MSTTANLAHLRGSKRVLSELRAVQSAVSIGNELPSLRSVDIVSDNVMKWRLSLSGFDDGVSGGRDLNSDLAACSKRHGFGDILMEVTFPERYPDEPFFLRVVRPRCVMYTGHVTAGGSVCIEALTLSGTPGSWQPAFTVMGILQAVVSNMVNAERIFVKTATGPGGLSGPLRVDMYNAAREYSEMEARSAFQRTLDNHRIFGWSPQNENDARRPVQKIDRVGLPGPSSLLKPGTIPSSQKAMEEEDIGYYMNDSGDDSGEDSKDDCELLRTAIEDAMEYAIDRNYSVMIEGGSRGNSDGFVVSITLYDIPDSSRALHSSTSTLTLTQINLQMRIENDTASTTALLNSLQTEPTVLPCRPPTLALVSPCLGGRESPMTLDDFRAATGKADDCTMDHAKALLSLLHGDLEASWPGESEAERRVKVIRRCSNSRDGMDAGVFSVSNKDLLDVDAEREADSIMALVASTSARAKGKNYLCQYLETIMDTVFRGGLCARCFCCGCRLPRNLVQDVPCTCSKRLCRYTFCNTITYAELASQIRRRPEAIEFLIMTAAQACASARADAIMDPPPSDFIDATTRSVAYGDIVKSLARVPPLADLAACRTEGEIKSMLSGEIWTHDDETAVREVLRKDLLSALRSSRTASFDDNLDALGRIPHNHALRAYCRRLLLLTQKAESIITKTYHNLSKSKRMYQDDVNTIIEKLAVSVDKHRTSETDETSVEITEIADRTANTLTVIVPAVPDRELGARLYRLLWYLICNVSYMRRATFEELSQVIAGRSDKKRVILPGELERQVSESKESTTNRLVAFRVLGTSAAFARNAEEHGKYALFHGSRMENWYSILKHGIRSLSGTRLMINGAAHGAGIYTSPTYSTSLSYSSSTSSTMATISSGRYNKTYLIHATAAVGIVHVADHPSAIARDSGNFARVISDPDYISLSYIVLPGALSFNTERILRDAQEYRDCFWGS